MDRIASGLVLGVLALSFAHTALANKINIYSGDFQFDLPIVDPNGNQYFATCGSSTTFCMQSLANVFAAELGTITQLRPIYVDGSFYLEEGTGYDASTGFAPSDPAGELAFLNERLSDLFYTSNPPLPPLPLTFVRRTNQLGSSFITNREYFSFKKDDWTIFFKNVSGESITLNFGPNATFDYYTEYGSVVPIPASLWLFASAVGVFGYLGKRKRAA